MGMPEELYVVAQRGEGEPRQTDLLQYLEPIEWSGVDATPAATVGGALADSNICRRSYGNIRQVISLAVPLSSEAICQTRFFSSRTLPGYGNCWSRAARSG